MKAFALIKAIEGGGPDIDFEATPLSGGYNRISGPLVAGYGAYLLSGKPAELLAIDKAPGVVGICAVTESGNVKWAELDGTITPAIRTKLNTWLSNRGYPTIPAGRTYRQVVMAVFRRLNDKFDLDAFDVADVG